jgi:hypothetical protein
LERDWSRTGIQHSLGKARRHRAHATPASARRSPERLFRRIWEPVSRILPWIEFASGSLTASTEAGDGHIQVGAGGSEVQALADEGGFHGFVTAVEAVEEAAQGPEIVGVDLGAGQTAAQAEILEPTLTISAISPNGASMAQKPRQRRSFSVSRRISEDTMPSSAHAPMAG